MSVGDSYYAVRKEKDMVRTVETCAECGSALKEWDFLKKRLRFFENRFYCTICRPFWTPAVSRIMLSRPMSGGARRLPVNRHLL